MTGTNWNIESHHTESDFLSAQYSPLASYYQILYSSLSHTIGHKSKEGQEGLEKSYKKKIIIKLSSEKKRRKLKKVYSWQ